MEREHVIKILEREIAGHNAAAGAAIGFNGYHREIAEALREALEAYRAPEHVPPMSILREHNIRRVCVQRK